MSNTTKQLLWVAAGTLAWFAVNSASPQLGGLILAALVIYVLVRLGPQIQQSIQGV